QAPAGGERPHRAVPEAGDRGERYRQEDSAFRAAPARARDGRQDLLRRRKRLPGSSLWPPPAAGERRRLARWKESDLRVPPSWLPAHLPRGVAADAPRAWERTVRRARRGDAEDGDRKRAPPTARASQPGTCRRHPRRRGAWLVPLAADHRAAARPVAGDGR